MKDGIEVMERDADDIVSEEGKGEIQLTSEDYLQGVIGMVNELVSFSFTLPKSQTRGRNMRAGLSRSWETWLIPAPIIDQFGYRSEL
jgi:hypothetical protein